ncbi:MAG TPA: hypothetical protein VFZ34_18270 [Blastocatellia bacterium]|nr:hypothetical protein [Blastocatellia bacterium]
MNSVEQTFNPQMVSEPNIPVVPVAAKSDKVRWGFAEFFVISQTAFPAILYFPGTQFLRVPIRVAPYGIGLIALVWWLFKQRRSLPRHPAGPWLWLAIAWTALMILHPGTNTLVAGLAQTLLYLAVMSPLFWASAFVQSTQRLKRLLVLLLICNAINSLVGVLQAYDPATWLPKEISYTFKYDQFSGMHLTYHAASGELMFRPPGLFDTPGFVYTAGMIAALLGMVFFLGKFAFWKRLIAGALALLGAAAVYLSHVRSGLVVMIVMMAVYFFVLIFIQKQFSKAILFVGIAALLLSLTFTYTILVGGKETSDRMLSLIREDPLKVYDKYRGFMVVQAFSTQIFEYPIGAGLARWGQMRWYFGDESNVNSPLVWAEIQLPAWIIDGGFVLLFLNLAALTINTSYLIRINRKASEPDFKFCASVIVAMTVGTSVMIFSYVLFSTQLGMQYWFFAGALHGVWQSNKLAQTSRPYTPLTPVS